MKIPRNLSGSDLIKILAKFGYEVTRQKGSHIRLSRTADNTTHHVSVPNHDPLKLGTLSAILSDVASHLQISRDDLLK
jgi:predicted RNA binding protein YcfA (HicA-like mRNA interferase family)